MQLLQLRYFYTVAQTLNISQSAEIHQIPQPAMSKTISKLESELGVALFVRAKNHLTLTAAGEKFFSEVSQALSHLDTGISHLYKSPLSVPTRLFLHITEHRLTTVTLLHNFSIMHPEVTLSVFNNPGEERKFDLAISLLKEDKRFDSHALLLHEQVKIIVNRENQLAKKSVIHISDLENVPFLIPSESSSMYQAFLPLANGVGFAPKVSVVCNDLECFAQYLLLDTGVALAPSIAWRNYCRPTCVMIPLSVPLSRNVYLHWNRSAMLNNPAANLLRDELTAFFQDLDRQFN